MMSKFAFCIAICAVAISSAALKVDAIDPPGTAAADIATEPKLDASKKPWVHGDSAITEVWNIHGGKCTVTYDQPVDCTPEAQALYAVSRDGLQAEMSGNLERRAALMDDDFTITRLRLGQQPKIICGKEAALEAMKEESDHMAKNPPSSIQFFYPMAAIYGDSAVVNYKCLVTGRGDAPRRSYGYVTNVFTKHADTWKQSHRRSRWKVVPAVTKPSDTSNAPP